MIKGENVIIYPMAKIIFEKEIVIGNNVIIDDFVFINGKGGIYIGSNVHIGSFSLISGGGGLIMGDSSGLSGGVKIYTGSENYIDGINRNPTFKDREVYRAMVIIGRNVIIGANSVVLPGVEIADNVAIGALSLVKESILEEGVYAGIPARRIK